MNKSKAAEHSLSWAVMAWAEAPHSSMGPLAPPNGLHVSAPESHSRFTLLLASQCQCSIIDDEGKNRNIR
jgi:hypothetical protein